MKQIFITSLGFLIVIFTAQLATATNISMLYPLYNYPNWYDPSSYIWDDIAASGGTIDITAVINPDNGPGDIGSPNIDYQQGLTDLTSGGINTIGYVSTDFGNRDIDDVKADIKKYNDDFNPGTNYSVTGIFFDEVSTSSNGLTLDYYSELHDFVRSSPETSNLDFIVFNHGTNVPEIYLDWADVNVIFEGSYSSWLNYTPDSYVANHDSSSFASLVYSTGGITSMQNALDLAFAQNVGFSFVTDDSLPNPWDELPSYWNAEVNHMATSPVPEPSTIYLFGTGFIVFVCIKWRSISQLQLARTKTHLAPREKHNKSLNPTA